MKNNRNFKLKTYDDIFNVKDPSSENNIKQININHLKNFENHPFKIIQNAEMDELLASIEENGILMPIIVRPSGDLYEIISGHRRKYCAEKLGIDEVPCLIKDLTYDEAVFAMIESNVQRKNILPSEKAFSYKMKLESIRRQGDRNELELPDKSSGSESADIVGEIYADSGRNVQRYIRLTQLSSFLLDAVDRKKISFGAGVDISYLSKEEMDALEEFIKENGIYPSLAHAKKMKSFVGELDKEAIKNIISHEIEEKENIKTSETDKYKDKINYDRAEIRKFFPVHFSAKDIEKAIIQMLEEKGI